VNTTASARVGLVVGALLVTVVEHLPFRKSKTADAGPAAH
jgi:hypothetical protein